MNCTRCQCNDIAVADDETKGENPDHQNKFDEENSDDIGSFSEIAGCLHLKASEKQVGGLVFLCTHFSLRSLIVTFFSV